MKTSYLICTLAVALIALVPDPSWARITLKMQGDYRYIESDGMPHHATGTFPNKGNPNRITPQNHHFRMPMHPLMAAQPIEVKQMVFGVAMNGVPFDPGTAEYWQNDRSSGWRYEALSKHVHLGLDDNHAHVQPSGAYHYHGIPTEWVESRGKNTLQLLGYAADGFPIYYDGRENSPQSSYRLKQGQRPSGPKGSYDGTFVQDYEYVAGLGDLDECNGRIDVTRQHPKGIYCYYLTETYPFVPRFFKGVPDESFRKAVGQHSPRDPQGHRPPPRRRR